MTPVERRSDLPGSKRPDARRAVILEWVTLAYLASAVFFLYLTLGSSQAMKAAWLEDMLSLLPPIAFLIAARTRRRPANARFPWGYHRAVSIAYLAASLALLLLGSYIVVESAIKLIKTEHPTIGLVEVFGEQVWLGWLMLAALAWSAVPAFLLGRAKLPLSESLHDEVLYADAKMNKADWMTAAAAMAGVIGIGFGLWWADAVAAIVIGADIVHDGVSNVRTSVMDLMDSRPTRHDGSDPHPLVARVERQLEAAPWIAEFSVRLREEGHIVSGEAFVVPTTADGLAERVEETMRALREVDWRVRDVVIAPVTTLTTFDQRR